MSCGNDLERNGPDGIPATFGDYLRGGNNARIYYVCGSCAASFHPGKFQGTLADAGYGIYIQPGKCGNLLDSHVSGCLLYTSRCV